MIISAHCILENFNEQLILENFNKHVCVFGKQIPIYNGKRISKRYIWSHFGDKPVINMFSSSENRHFLHNAAAIYSKAILRDYPFDEFLTGKEDRYWAQIITKEKKSYIYDPSFVVKHHYTPEGKTWKGIG